MRIAHVLWLLAPFSVSLLEAADSADFLPQLCEREATAEPQHGFISTCGRHAWTEGDDVTLYACVPRLFSGTPSSFDPVSRAFAAVSVVGRVHPAEQPSHAWDNVYSIDFESRPSFVLRTFDCLPGIVTGLRAGSYTFSALHEWSNWFWDLPWNSTNATAPRFPFGVALEDAWEKYNAVVLRVHGSFSVTPKIRAHRPDLPACTSDLRGRWLGGKYFPASCSLHKPTYDEFDACMAKMNGEVRVYGDSHTRRAMKTLFTKGNWCNRRREARACTCEDSYEKNVSFEYKSYQNGSHVSMRWMSGTRSPKVFDDMTSGHVKVMVVGGLSAWSLAGDDFSTYISLLEKTVHALRRSDVQTLIFRNAPAFCCTVDQTRQRRYTSKRDVLFNRLFRQRMQAAFPNALWWDTRAITEARPLDALKANSESCNSNHMDSQLVEDDLGIFMHFICMLAK